MVSMIGLILNYSYIMSALRTNLGTFMSACDGGDNRVRRLRENSSQGLDVPFIGYVELDANIMGRVFPGPGFLIVRDPTGTPIATQKMEVPSCRHRIQHIPRHECDVDQIWHWQ